MKLTTNLRYLINSPGGRVGRYAATEQLLGLLARPIDILMIFFIWHFPGSTGVLLSFFVCGALYFAFCVGVVYLNDLCLKNNLDITGISELREKADKNKFVRWILKRNTTIFLVGSWFKLDPDYVTLVLRDPKKGFWANIIKITLPATVLSMAVWTTVYWGACRGFTWGLWLFNHT